MLSVCCLYGGPPSRLVALLQLLREPADEIVVAVDERVDTAELGAVAELTDTLLRYQYALHPERARGWLHQHATGDWVFWIDGDEVPGEALLAALAAPPSGVTHAFLPRRWLWRDGWLDEPPWRPDYQLRLVRRDAARYPGILHVPVKADGPHVYLDAPLYHFDLLIKDRATREEQVRRFERARPGLRIGGRPLNEAFYLPESRDPRVAAVPPADAELVRRVIEPEPVAAGPPVAAPLATRETIDTWWGERPLADGAYRARLEVDRLDPAIAGEVVQVDVLVTNLGTELWRHGPDAIPEIRVSYRGLPDALRTPLPHDLAGGETARVPVAIAAPPEPGRYPLTIDLVHERRRWFEQGVAIELEVRPRRRAIVLVGQPPGDEPFDARVDAALAGLDPALEPLLVGPRPDWLRDRFGAEAHERVPDWRPDAVVSVPAGRRRDRLRLELLARRLRRRARG